MNKLEKFLLKLSKKEKMKLRLIIRKIRLGELGGLDNKKLRGYANIYRIRKGNFRINYIKEKNTNFIISIKKRDERTYKNL